MCLTTNDTASTGTTQEHVATPVGARVPVVLKTVTVGVRNDKGTVSIVALTVASLVNVDDVADVGSLSESRLGEVTATHVSGGQTVLAVDDLSVEENDIRVSSKSLVRVDTLAEDGSRVVTDETVADIQPPVALEELVLEGELVLSSTTLRQRTEVNTRVDILIDLNPTSLEAVVSALVVSLLGVTVGGVVGEQERTVVHEVRVVHPTSLDGLTSGATISLGSAADSDSGLQQREVIVALEVGVVDVELSTSSVVANVLVRTGIPVSTCVATLAQSRSDIMVRSLRQTLGRELLGLADHGDSTSRTGLMLSSEERVGLLDAGIAGGTLGASRRVRRRSGNLSLRLLNNPVDDLVTNFGGLDNLEVAVRVLGGSGHSRNRLEQGSKGHGLDHREVHLVFDLGLDIQAETNMISRGTVLSLIH